MSTKSLHSLSQLSTGRKDWKIKVKVLRNWRGASNTGEVFKAFNVILIDQQESKIHAFVPTKCAQQHESSLIVGNICIIKNFTVQKYKEDDKFRPVHDEKQLIFSSETIIKQVEEKFNNFAIDAFDFYDHSELDLLADKTHYLIDVVGIVQNHESIVLREIPTRHGRNQFQVKFTMTDGSSMILVTFWDSMAKTFHKELLEQEETPIIVILTAARCGSWNKELDISNVAATAFFFNYNHHSVKEIRKMISTPEFTQKELGKQKRKVTEICNVEQIKNLGKEYIAACVILHATIRYVDEVEPWLFFFCTECKQKMSSVDQPFRCLNCNRRIPHPEKRFILNVVASDASGPLEIQLQDRAVRILIGKTAQEIFNKHKDLKTYPKVLKNLTNVDITVKIRIEEENLEKEDTAYYATNICRGFYTPEPPSQEASQMQQSSTTQASASTYHIEGMSDLNFQ